jgi:four helix bundle protein
MGESMRKKAEKFQDLEVWQKAHQLVLVVYKITQTFPNEEKFGLVSQMRRAGVSIAANIAEGFKKRGTRDKANFYNVAQGSLEELRYYFLLSKDLGYLRTNDELMESVDTIGRMLHGLVSSVRSE